MPSRRLPVQATRITDIVFTPPGLKSPYVIAGLAVGTMACLFGLGVLFFGWKTNNLFEGLLLGSLTVLCGSTVVVRMLALGRQSLVIREATGQLILNGTTYSLTDAVVAPPEWRTIGFGQAARNVRILDLWVIDPAGTSVGHTYPATEWPVDEMYLCILQSGERASKARHPAPLP